MGKNNHKAKKNFNLELLNRLYAIYNNNRMLNEYLKNKMHHCFNLFDFLKYVDGLVWVNFKFDFSLEIVVQPVITTPTKRTVVVIVSIFISSLHA